MKNKEYTFNCKKCNGKKWIEQKDKDGNTIKGLTGSPQLKPCVCVNIERWYSKLRDNNLYARLENGKFNTFKPYNQDLKNAYTIAYRFTKDYKNKTLLLTGRSGTGKTHLAYSVINEIVDKSYMDKDFQIPKIVLFNQLTRQLQSYRSFNKESQLTKLMNVLTKTNILFIDDFLKFSNNDNWILERLFEIIDARTYEEGKTTIITTERSIKDLLNIDEALTTRLLEGAKGEKINYYYEINSSNYRVMDNFVHKYKEVAK